MMIWICIFVGVVALIAWSFFGFIYIVGKGFELHEIRWYHWIVAGPAVWFFFVLDFVRKIRK